jgi:hypothetical protein
VVSFETKVNILSDLYENYRTDKGFKAFIEFNDLGLPLAYFLRDGLIIEISADAVRYIEETWELLIGSIDVSQDKLTDGMTLDDLLNLATE